MSLNAATLAILKRQAPMKAKGAAILGAGSKLLWRAEKISAAGSPTLRAQSLDETDDLPIDAKLVLADGIADRG
jgi:hypothetical protein